MEIPLLLLILSNLLTLILAYSCPGKSWIAESRQISSKQGNHSFKSLHPKPPCTASSGHTQSNKFASIRTLFTQLPPLYDRFVTEEYSVPSVTGLEKRKSRSSATTGIRDAFSSNHLYAASIGQSHLLATQRDAEASPTIVIIDRPFVSGKSSNVHKADLKLSTMASQDIFAEPIDTKAPPSNIPRQNDHPVPRKGIKAAGILQTNKFYSNFYLGDQRAPAFTFPYSVSWVGGKGGGGSWGLACSHIEEHQRVFGKEKMAGTSSYYLNPVGIQSMILSAKELGCETALSTDMMTAFSTTVHLSANKTAAPAVSFPLVQGMAYLTAQYDGSTPLIQSGVFFKAVSRATHDPKEYVTKYNFHLEDGTTWRVYAYRTKGDALDLKITNNSLAESKHAFFGTIQVCKDPGTEGSEDLLDDGAGIYPLTLTLSGSATGKEGTYSFAFEKKGHQLGHLYVYALPHHLASFDGETTKRVRGVRLLSPTKGTSTLVKGTGWTMVERHMPIGMDFAPWHPEKGTLKCLSDKAKSTIRAVAAKELSQNIVAQTNLDSMYFSGKVRLSHFFSRFLLPGMEHSLTCREQALSKFATILYVVDELLGDKALAKKALGPLKAAFDTFAANNQRFPLNYESALSVSCVCIYVTVANGVVR